LYWSPDGRTIACQLESHGNIWDLRQNNSLKAADDPLVVTTSNGLFNHPAVA